MTTEEVAKAYREFSLDNGHYAEVMVAINNNYDLDEVARKLNDLYSKDEF